MRVHVCAVGRLKKGPERALVDDYLTRFNRTGRPLALGPATEHEVDDRKAPDAASQAVQLRRAAPEGAKICLLDERGDHLSSPEFARRLAGWRDDGVSDLAFLIGAADGLDPALRAEGAAALSFGAMVWPHMLARAMLAEQLYRAAAILAGTPYHRA